MIQIIRTTIDGVELVLVNSEKWERKEGDPDLWMPSGDWSGPRNAAPITEWPEIIRAYEVQSQIEAGFEVWDVSDKRPKYWHKRPAVFRAKGGVETRNGTDPKSLYHIHISRCAPDTPEVAEAIEKAREAHRLAIEASDAFHKAWNAIPRLTVSDTAELPISPREKP